MTEALRTDDLRFERLYKVPVARVFEIVTQPEHLADWWGPEGIARCEGHLDFTAKGPWDSTMINQDGARFKVSGQVTKLDPPNIVAFTWGWHDENDARGDESHVTIELTEEDGGTRFVMTHRGLSSKEAAEQHNRGWTSSLRKLDAAVNA
ncbi:SRPBCC family protein [Pararhodobacter oceanensis]|uniref:SRPBCC domain-containing protein n=1 Tax=Pararhodobacter oceanensis TaxID=2172121 RepID=A0A2T8HUN2_9RHOB|nr:SRPBCC domain-containing protein [Pararhodobacter oceanensis]PVH29108.1 SRPBCC domain-containing protein [Pararhodobacter oceanensis]